ncbi:beta strand repeat-containing protein [Flagellimonas sp.]|uniref:beta strand repeat-containing protein n=1 Tax=Flagellimonas sp. TaxID=2058762 RepID=UPI003BABA55F
MKTYIVYLVIGLVAINSLSAQVKIGDNPQNLNPASLLELQSSNRVLVITRVTDAQMSGISPLPGAVVYNTDQGCLHYYNGTEWINICEELDNSFTVSTRADSLQQVNPNARDNTIAILESINPDGSTNYNFEVNRITGANIVDTSINGSTKLQNESVTNNKLAEKSVGLRNLADATNTGDLLMYNGTAWNFVNRTDLLNTQLDSIVGNEVVGPTDATLLVNGAGSQADPLTLDVAEGGITAFEIATDAVTTDEILNGNILTEDISDDAVTTVKIIDGAVTNAKLDKANIPLSGFGPAAANVDLGNNRIVDLADPVDALDAVNLQSLNTAILASESNDNDTDATNELQDLDLTTNILTLSNPATPGNQVDLSSYLDNTDEQDIDTNGNPGNIQIDNGSVLNLNVNDADSSPTNEINTRFEVVGTNLELEDSNGTLPVPLADIVAGVDTDDQTVTDFSIVGTDLSITLENGNTATVALADIAAGVDTDDQTVTDFSIVGTDLSITLEDGNTATVALADIAAGVDTDDQTVTDFSIVGTDLSITLENGNTATVALADIAAGVDTDDQTVTDFSIVGTDLSITLENGNTATVALADIAAGVDTDDQTVTDFSIVGTDLSITLENGNTATVALADIAAAVDTTLATNDLTQSDANRVYDINAGSLSFTNGSVGVETTGNPTSTLQTGGSFATGIDNLSGSIDLTSINIQTIIITGNSTITLPPANATPGRIYIIKCPDTSAIIASPDYTVTTLGGQNFLDSQGEIETNFGAGITQLQSDGTNWQQIN